MQSIFTRRAEALFGPVVDGEVLVDGHAVIHEGKVRGLVSFVVGATERHGRQQVKADLSVGFGVLDGCAVLGRLQLVGIAT